MSFHGDQAAIKTYLLCKLANMPVTPPTPPPPTECALGIVFATQWNARVVANGGASTSAATQAAIANFQCGLITDGLDTLMISWNAVVPDNLIASRTPQLLGGGNDPWADYAIPLVNGNLSVNGLTVAGGTNTGMDTGLNPTVIYANDTDCGITTYMTNSVASGTQNCGTGRVGGFDFGLLPDFPGFGFFFECFDQNGACPGRVTNAVLGVFNGYISNNRTGASAAASYGANSGTPHFAIGTCATLNATTRPNQTIGFIKATSDIAGAYGAAYSFCAVHHGLTSAQSALFFARIQTLRTSLGGGFV